jgi:hypothetical protein
MIYEFPEVSSSISQGDIFFNIPIVDLPTDALPILTENESARLLSWEE